MTGGGVVEPLISIRHVQNDMKDEDISQSFCGEEDEIGPINGVKDFVREFSTESKKLWYVAGPSIFTSFCQYALMATTMMVVGHIGTIQLAAVSVENSVIAAIPYGVLLGMSSALETFCGQAFGANQLEMLGIHMQRSLLILNIMALAMVSLFVFATPILKRLGQTDAISAAAGKFSLWMIPQQFAYAMIFPTTKFLQAQSKVMAIAVITAAALGLHLFLSWLFMLELQWGLGGAAVSLDVAWWVIAIGQFLYIISGTCGEAWSGFSWKTFENLWKFVKVSVASAVMICSEIWYISVLTLFVGNLKNAEVSVDTSSICSNILGWISMAGLGFHVATSVRVSNELGSGHPGRVKFSAVVAGSTSLLFGFFIALVLMVTSKQYPTIFSNSSEVIHLVEELTPLLGICITLTNFQYTLTGAAIGAGWQVPVACINVACYFLLGIPLGVLMGFKFKMGVKGLWCGMLLGLFLQCSVLLCMLCVANWDKEASMAKERLKGWRVEIDEGTSNSKTSSRSVRKL
ncbi:DETOXIFICATION 29-like [Olea europaea subsp. europaea]|uniref:Protein DETOXIFICATION n=1 Tax=Olea europaea subsp. europaea TaxID=158383 RepID=A0A8S0UK39_OLEEU|nr:DETOXIFICATION 29-like [Olea europaea subsp. europaea]